MKDIDFEELDRAVSSVLGTSLGQDSSKSMRSVEEGDNTHVSRAPEADTPAKKTLVQKRSAGRFMDVVHSSSDMKMKHKPTVSRQGPSIEPASSFTLDQEDERDIDKAAESESMAADVHTMPDPLDFHDTSSNGGDSEKETDELYARGLDGDDVGYDSAQDDTDALDQAASELAGLASIMGDGSGSVSLDAPFMNGSEVEKRPLGAFSTSETDGTLLSSEAKEHLDIVDQKEGDSTPLVDEDMRRAMEAALAGDDEPTPRAQQQPVVVESHDDIRDEDEPKQEEESADDTQKVLDAHEELVPEELKSDIVAVESREVEAVAEPAIRIGSIQQQYKEKEQAQSDEVAPVFDTTSYHQPIKHVEKKKSGWSRVIIIILLALIGVGVGAALYYFDVLSLIS